MTFIYSCFVVAIRFTLPLMVDIFMRLSYNLFYNIYKDNLFFFCFFHFFYKIPLTIDIRPLIWLTKPLILVFFCLPRPQQNLNAESYDINQMHCTYFVKHNRQNSKGWRSKLLLYGTDKSVIWFAKKMNAKLQTELFLWASG